MNRLALRTSASVFVLAIASGTAYAQDVETVTVTGVRASVDSALGIKKDATQIMDSIVAEDIGKLPDTTVVEALQHVTGVQILQNGYEPSTVLIRGLPDTQTLLNGRQIFTSTGRTISLPDFPAELLARVDVHKASSATDITGGIAGLIDVHLHRPFDFDGFVLAAGTQASYPTLNGTPYLNGSALVSNRWKTDIGEIGLLVDASYHDTKSRDDVIGPGGRAGLTSGPVAGATNTPLPVCTSVNPATCATGNNLSYSNGIRPGYAARYGGSADQQNGDVARGSLNIASQWRPTDTVEVFAEMFYTALRNRVTSDFFVGQTGNCDDAARDTVFPGTNTAQQLYSGCFAITSNQPNTTKENTYQLASGASWDVTDHFNVKTEFSTTGSRSANRTPVLDDYYNYNEPDGFHTIVNYKGTGGTLLDMPGNEEINGPFYYSQFYDNFNDARGSAWDGRVDGNYDFGAGSFIRNIEFGFRYARRNVHNYGAAGGGLGCAAITGGNPAAANNKYNLDAYNGAACTAFRASATVNGTTTGGFAAANNALAQTDVQVGGIMIPTADLHCTHGSFFDGSFGMQKFCDASTNYLYYDTEAVRSIYGYSGQQENSPSSEYRASEGAKDSYIKVDYAFDVYGFPVDGNFGGRMVDTLLTINGDTSQFVPLTVAVPTATALQAQNCTTCIVYTPTQTVKETNDFLPSINMRVTLADDLFFRFSASKTETRPSFGQLSPIVKLTAPTGNLPGTISGGNPNLNAEKSVNLDADVEYYWGHGNHVSAALFHRDVSGYIETENSQTTISGTTYNVSSPINFQSAAIEGVEAGYSQFLDFLPDFWSGFGWDINGTYIAGIFNNISHLHFNTSGIYEKGPYSVRVSWTWSSKYQSANATGPQPQFLFVAPRNNLDASFNYSWNDRVTLTLDGTNISNSHFRSFNYQPGDSVATDEAYFANSLQEYDRIFSIGVRYRM